MRRLFLPLMFLAGIILMYSGCVSQDTGQIHDQGKTAAPEEGTEVKKVREEVHLVSKELSYYPDGVLATYRVYTYAEEGVQKLEEELYNSDDELLERKVFKYENGNQRSKQTYQGLGELLQTYDGNGELIQYHIFKYSDAGLITEDSLYDMNDELRTRQEFEYDKGGNKTEWRVFNTDGALLSYTGYEYENGLNTVIKNHSPDGVLLDRFLLEYDSDARLVKRTWFSGDGAVKQIRIFIYRNGGLIEEQVLLANRSIRRKIIYTNNSSGDPLEVVYMDGAGNIREILAFEYVNRTRVTYTRVKE